MPERERKAEMNHKRENLKALKATNDFDREQLPEILHELLSNENHGDCTEFYTYAHDWRFIKGTEVDQIMRDGLASDVEMLGRLDAELLSKSTLWPVDMIKAAQDGEAWGSLGDALLVDPIHIVKIQMRYVLKHGYGQYFAHIDSKTKVITLNGEPWLYFRCG